METLKQVYLLQMRTACAEMEMATAQANRDTQHGDGWRCDYDEWWRDASKRFDEAYAQLQTIDGWQN